MLSIALLSSHDANAGLHGRLPPQPLRDKRKLSSSDRFCLLSKWTSVRVQSHCPSYAGDWRLDVADLHPSLDLYRQYQRIRPAYNDQQWGCPDGARALPQDPRIPPTLWPYWAGCKHWHWCVNCSAITCSIGTFFRKSWLLILLQWPEYTSKALQLHAQGVFIDNKCYNN